MKTMRLIDADAILYWEDDSGIKSMGYVRKGQIDSMPTIEAEPVKHGRWIDKEDPYGFFDTIPVCSECGHTTKMREKYRYCPNCGAKMDLDEVEE